MKPRVKPSGRIKTRGAVTLYPPGSPVTVSAASSLALMGDALLYAVLAAQAPTVGIPLVSVGLLLSANRFVRLITNHWASAVFQRYGREWPFFIAVVVSAFTTFAYGLPWGLWVLLPARILWGACWSFLNLGMYLSVLEYSGNEERGLWMGRIKSISRTGTIIAVILGGYMTDLVGFRPVVFTLGALALVGALIAFRDVRVARHRTPQHSVAAPADPSHDATDEAGGKSTVPATLLYAMGFIFGFIMNGIVVGTLSLLVLQRYGEPIGLFGTVLGAATVSGLLLGARWVVEIAVGPMAGAVGDRLRSERVVPITATLQAVGLIALAYTQNPNLFILLGLVLFLAGVTASVCLDAVVGQVAIERNRVGRMMSHYITAQDVGSAIGPLVGYLVGIGVGLQGLYVWASLLSVAVTLVFARHVTLPRRTVQGH